jgi:hypothetical protein
MHQSVQNLVCPLAIFGISLVLGMLCRAKSAPCLDDVCHEYRSLLSLMRSIDLGGCCLSLCRNVMPKSGKQDLLGSFRIF